MLSFFPSSETVLGQSRQEPFGDDAIPFDADPACCLAGRMGRDDDANPLACFAQGVFRTIVESAHHSAFRVLELLIRREMHAGLHLSSLQELRVFAARDLRQSSQVGEDGPRAIVALQTEEGMLFGDIVGLHLRLDCRHSAAQFLSVRSVARIANAGEPRVRVRVEHRGACAHHFPALPSSGARGTQGTHTALGRGSIRTLWQGPLTSGLSRAIHVEDDPPTSLSIPSPSHVFLCVQRASQQIFQKERAQGRDRRLIKGGEKAAACRTRRQTVASKECHERTCPGLSLLVKGFQRPFAADGRAEKHRENIDHLVPPEAATGKAHLFFNGTKHAMSLDVMREQRDLSEPGRDRGYRLHRGLDVHRRRGDRGQKASF